MSQRGKLAAASLRHASRAHPRDLRTNSFSPFSNSAGQGMAEYVIIGIVVAIVIIVALRMFGGSIKDQFQNATDAINAPQDKQLASNSGDDTVSSRTSAGGALDSGKESGKKSGAIESGGGGHGAQVSALKDAPVGDEESVVGEIAIDWQLLAVLAAIVCGLGIYIVFRVNKDKKKTAKKKKKKFTLFPPDANEGGQAIAEFVISAITFFFVILGVIQLAMVLNAYALVRYAAYNAARAAIVHAHDPDHLKEMMQEAARLSLVAVFPRHGRADHQLGFAENYLGAKATDTDPSLTFFNEPITEVSIVNNQNLPPGTVVTFDDPAQAERGIITVQVVHRYELVIPLVNRILFYLYKQYREEGGYQGESVDRVAMLSDRMRREGGEFHDIEYRIPIVAHYTMRLQDDYVVE